MCVNHVINSNVLTDMSGEELRSDGSPECQRFVPFFFFYFILFVLAYVFRTVWTERRCDEREFD